jgi:hypothetical protein
MVDSRGWAIATALFALLLAAEPALGAARRSPGKSQAQEKAARKACLTGDYANGVSILADLFVDSEDPVYIFNQGRCLEQNARYGDAIVRFEEYLRICETVKLDPADRAAAHKHIEDCKAKLPEPDKSQGMAPQPMPQPMVQPLPQPIPLPQAATQVAETPRARAEPTPGGKGLVVGGIALGGVGVAAVVAGVVFNLKANSMVNDMETKVDDYTSSKNSSQKTYATLTWVGYGVGAACIAAGAVLVAVGASRGGSSSTTEVSLVPAVAPGQAGVLLRGGF